MLMELPNVDVQRIIAQLPSFTQFGLSFAKTLV